MNMQGEVQLVRETLEGIVEPSVATSVLFDSLSVWGRGIPQGPSEVLELVRGPLKDMLHRRIGDEAGPALAVLEAHLISIANPVSVPPSLPPEPLEDDFPELEESGDLDVVLDIDFDEDDENDTMTAQMTAMEQPVIVLVVAGYREFAQRLTAAIGMERVHTITVGDVNELRHSAFSTSPQIVVVDAAQPAAVAAPDLARALKALPDATISFVWGEETRYGKELRLRLEQLEARSLFLAREEGIEPLLDLVLSRYKTATLPPPPR